MQPLVVSEVFGPTLQGEGPSLGRPCAFVRLGGCNLDCAWCDTPYTWDWTRFSPRDELRSLQAADVLAQLAGMPVDMLVISGGEPMLQQDRLVPLLEGVRASGWRIEIETNGTIAPTPEVAGLVDQFTVSPKLANASIAEHRRLVDHALTAFRDCGKACFKFVVAQPGDLDEVDALVERLGLEPVFIMPEAVDAEGVLAGMVRLADAVVQRGYRLTPRLHLLLWGNARGR
ncbi:MAG TPA: 7-carboxy-7-deazaguanine synthase QueE [Candidatus Dormibacteraeota bacterium]|nr:7-carboxy-7-deazaguanine synthase QueE [Candidatus Dormibacteraeota bacterium]